MRLRFPLVARKGGILRVCVIARFSTEEQRKRRRSNSAQHKYVRKMVGQWWDREVEFTEISDEAISGEIKDRPGIAQFRDGILKRAWDLVVAEDSSRIYREPSFCREIVALAVDNECRVICIGDDVDTQEEGWQERLYEAQLHHCKDNKYLRRRLQRTMEDLWEIGAAIGPLRTGYVRRPTKPATEHEDAQGPFFDEIDPKLEILIRRAFKMIRKLLPPAFVATYLTRHRVPKRDGIVTPWTDANVIQLIHCEKYKGVEYRRKKYAHKQLSTGKTTLRDNAPENVQYREMPHLRIVSDELWKAANKIIEGRKKGPGPPRGEANPLYGKARDTNTPMSQIFVCGVCGAKMYRLGKAYGCSTIHRARHEEIPHTKCWNYATADRDEMHEKVYSRAINELLASQEHVDVLLKCVAAFYESRSDLHTEENRLVADIASRKRKCQNLSAAIEGRKRAPSTLIERIDAYEVEIAGFEKDLTTLREDLAKQGDIPTKGQLLDALQHAVKTLGSKDLQARDFLKVLLAGPIRAVPYQTINGDRIVLRAHFTLNLIGLCPEELRQQMERTSRLRIEEFNARQVECIEDLFIMPKYVTHAQTALAMKTTHTLLGIGVELGLSKRTAKRAEALGKIMAAANATDAYVRLEGPPKSGSRWHRFNRRAR